MALTKKDKEDVAAIAAQAVIAAMQAMGAAQAAPAPAKVVDDLPDDAEDEAEARRTIEEEKRKIATVEDLAKEILPHILKGEHSEIFDWMRNGGSYAEMIRQILRQRIALEKPNWREATKGMVGGSTKNPATIASFKALRGE